MESLSQSRPGGKWLPRYRPRWRVGPGARIGLGPISPNASPNFNGNRCSLFQVLNSSRRTANDSDDLRGYLVPVLPLFARCEHRSEYGIPQEPSDKPRFNRVATVRIAERNPALSLAGKRRSNRCDSGTRKDHCGHRKWKPHRCATGLARFVVPCRDSQRKAYGSSRSANTGPAPCRRSRRVKCQTISYL